MLFLIRSMRGNIRQRHSPLQVTWVDEQGDRVWQRMALESHAHRSGLAICADCRLGRSVLYAIFLCDRWELLRLRVFGDWQLFWSVRNRPVR